MRRFLLLAVLGAVATLAGHATTSLGLHPERLAPATTLLQGCAALAAGTALFATGMLGLAEGYEKLAVRLGDLLERKALPDPTPELQISGAGDLRAASAAFWRGYVRAAGGVCLFLAGLLALTAALTRVSATLFLVGVGAGVACLGAIALALCGKGLARVRRTHRGVDRSARILERQPDRRLEESRPAPPARVPRYRLFPRHRGAAHPAARPDRELDRRRAGAASRPV